MTIQKLFDGGPKFEGFEVSEIKIPLSIAQAKKTQVLNRHSDNGSIREAVSNDYNVKIAWGILCSKAMSF